MLQFQLRLQPETAQVDVPGNNGRSTAGAFLQAVSEQLGIPAEKLKLAHDVFSNPSSFITNMNKNVYSHILYWVVVENDALMKKNRKDAETGTNLFIEDMAKLLEDPETSDFTLKCGSKSFKVHKAILGARSKVFRAMFLSGMKEAVDGEAVITDIDEKTLEEILNYLYSGKLSGKDFAVKSLCYAAKKYELDHLMDLICERIRAVKLEAGELADVFISAEMFSKREMFDIAMEKLKENKGMLKDIKFVEKIKEWPDLLYRIIVLII